MLTRSSGDGLYLTMDSKTGAISLRGASCNRMSVPQAGLMESMAVVRTSPPIDTVLEFSKCDVSRDLAITTKSNEAAQIVVFSRTNKLEHFIVIISMHSLGFDGVVETSVLVD